MQTALRSLYEEYRFDAVKFTFVPIFTQTIGGAANGGGAGRVAYAIDRAPWSAVPTSIIDILRQNDCKMFNITRGFSVTVRKPAWGTTAPLDGYVAGAALRDATTTTSHAWCSCRDYNWGGNGLTQPAWYGLDLAIEGTNGATQCYKVYKTYYLTFRNQN